MDFTMRIGIIGTSHSQGIQPYSTNLKQFYQSDEKKFTKPLEYHLQAAMPEYKFYNVAASGRGTERYLSCIVHLKQKYSVDAVLLEYANNRTANSYWIHPSTETENIKQFSEDYIENNREYIGSINNLSGIGLGIINQFSKHEQNAWRKISKAIFYETGSARLQGINDIKQAWDLCDQLDITVVAWEFTNYYITYRKNFLPFKSWMHTTDTDKDNWFCDGHHANDKMYKLGAHEYFKPLIVDAINAS